MITETITNISIYNSSGVFQSILNLTKNNQNSLDNLPYVSFTLSGNSFKRIKTAFLYIRILNAPTGTDYYVTLRHGSGYEDVYADIFTDQVGDKYLKFNISYLVCQHDLLTSYHIANHSNVTFTLFTSGCYVEAEYEEPYDYLDKQQLVLFDLGKSFNIKQDVLTLNQYISKPLFNDNLFFNYRLVYDYVNPSASFLNFFPQGWKINLLETLTSVTDGYLLHDENCNRRLFKPTNDSSIFVDSTGTGLLLELQSGGTYKIFDPISSFYKEFDNSGRITSCHTTNDDSFSVTYSSLTITIADSRGNIVTIDKTDDIFTITSNTITQTYTLNINNSNQLQSISFISCLLSETIISDSFEYTQSRLTKITSFDDYSVEFNLDTYKLTVTHKYKTTTMKTWFLEYKETYVIHKDVTNNIENRYYLDENKNVIIGGENTGIINKNDIISYVNSTFGFASSRFQNNLSHQLFFANNSSSVTFNVVDLLDDERSYSTTTINIDPNSYYLFIAKIKQTNIFPVPEDGSKGLNVIAYLGYNDSVLLCPSRYGEQYVSAVINSGEHEFAMFSFETYGLTGEFEISNVFLIKISGLAHYLAWRSKTIPTPFPANVFLATSVLYPSIRYNFINSQSELLTIRDVKVSNLIHLKYGYPKYAFSNNLKSLYVLDNSNSTYSILINGSSYTFDNADYFYIDLLAVENSETSFVADIFEKDNNGHIIKQSLLRKNSNQYVSSETFDFDGKLLFKTDCRGVTTTNTFDSNNCLINSTLSHNNSSLTISKTFDYDSSKRLISETSLVGSQASAKTIVYASTLDLPTSLTDGEGNQAHYEYSPRYEHVKRFYKTYDGPSTFGHSHLANSTIVTEKDKKLRTTKLTNQCGDYLFTYDDNKNKLKKIQYQKNLFLAPIFLSNPNVNEPNSEVIPPFNQMHTETLFEISPWSCEDNSADLKFPNNYQYCCVYDSRGRFQYVDDWTVTDFHYYVSYNSSQNGGTVSNIYDASGNEVETTTFTHTNGKISRIVMTGFATVTRDYAYDSFNRITSTYEELSNCGFSLAHKYITLCQFSYDDIDDSVLTTATTLYEYQYVLPGINIPMPVFTSVGETKTLDVFGRSSSLKTTYDNYNVGFNSISYHSSNNQTSLEISRVDYCDNTYTEYDYDKVGNVISVSGTKQENIEYEYDKLYRLVKEINNTQGYYIEYTYDASHNITSATKKTISNNTEISSDTYTYDQGDMTNRLKTFNNVDIAYDTNSNITSLDGATLTYYRGNKMSNYSKNGVTGQYKYNGRGLRTFKRNGSIIHRYIYDGDKLVREIIYDSEGVQDFHQFVYLYGISGLIGFVYDTTLYLYEKDILNNIIGIYRYTSGTGLIFVNEYRYDAYGNTSVITSSGTIDTDPTSIGNLNPFRYKSYYFDSESGYYYCQARYYAPFLRRWLSLDSVAYIDNSSIFGLNLYCYCNDNPVMYRDEKGKFAISLTTLGLIIGAVLGATAGGLISYNIAKSNGEIGQDLFLHTMRGIVVGGIAGAAIGAGIGALVTHFTGIIGFSITSHSIIAVKPITVLGSYPLYKNIALELGASFYQIDNSIYESLLKEERWANNAQFLMDANKLGTNFVIFTEKVVNAAMDLWKELQLLGEYNIPWEMF